MCPIAASGFVQTSSEEKPGVVNGDEKRNFSKIKILCNLKEAACLFTLFSRSADKPPALTKKRQSKQGGGSGGH